MCSSAGRGVAEFTLLPAGRALTAAERGRRCCAAVEWTGSWWGRSKDVALDVERREGREDRERGRRCPSATARRRSPRRRGRDRDGECHRDGMDKPLRSLSQPRPAASGEVRLQQRRATGRRRGRTGFGCRCAATTTTATATRSPATRWAGGSSRTTRRAACSAQAHRRRAAQGRREVRAGFARVPRPRRVDRRGARAPKASDPRIQRIEVVPRRAVLKPGDDAAARRAWPTSPTARRTTSPAGEVHAGDHRRDGRRRGQREGHGPRRGRDHRVVPQQDRHRDGDGAVREPGAAGHVRQGAAAELHRRAGPGKAGEPEPAAVAALLATREFIRRAFLDTIGVLPTADESRGVPRRPSRRTSATG